MKLYKAKIQPIAAAVIENLTTSGALEVVPTNRAEAELDLVAIMEEYSRRDFALRDAVKAVSYTHLTLPTICSV